MQQLPQPRRVFGSPYLALFPARSARRPTRRHHAAAPLLLGLLLAATTFGGILAAPRAAASPRGEALHRAALQAARDGLYLKAKTLWKQAYRLDHEPKYLYNLGLVAVESDKPVEALGYFERFLREAPERPPYRALSRKARRRVHGLLQRVATLEIEAPQAGVKVFVDRRAMGKGPLRTRVRLTQGEHLVVATLPGHHGQTLTLRLYGGQHKRLTITLSKIQPRVVKQKVRIRYLLPRWLPWTGLGVGLAGAVAGVAALALYPGYYKRYNESIQTDPTNPNESLRRTGDGLKYAGIALVVVGGVIAAGGLVAVLLNRPKLIHEDEAPVPRLSSERQSAWIPQVTAIGPMGFGLRWDLP